MTAILHAWLLAYCFLVGALAGWTLTRVAGWLCGLCA